MPLNLPNFYYSSLALPAVFRLELFSLQKEGRELHSFSVDTQCFAESPPPPSMSNIIQKEKGGIAGEQGPVIYRKWEAVTPNIHHRKLTEGRIVQQELHFFQSFSRKELLPKCQNGTLELYDFLFLFFSTFLEEFLLFPPHHPFGMVCECYRTYQSTSMVL